MTADRATPTPHVLAIVAEPRPTLFDPSIHHERRPR